MIKDFLKYKMQEFSVKYIRGEYRTQKEYTETVKKYLNENFKINKNGEIVISENAAKEIMKLIKRKSIPLVLSDGDNAVSLDKHIPGLTNNYEKNPFKKIGDLVCIHKTRIPPQDDKIITTENSRTEGTICFQNPETRMNYEVPYNNGSDTIHLTLNCPVENHEYGNDWDSYEYAVMIGLDKIDKSKICDVKSEDTFVEGNLELGKEYFLFCPLGNREQMQKANPNATIIEYDGISLNQAISSMIVYSGRKLEPYGGFGWGDSFDSHVYRHEDEKYLSEIVRREGYPYHMSPWVKDKTMMHSESKHMARRMWKREYRALINLLEFNKINNIDMPNEIIEQLFQYNGVYLPGTPEVSIEEYKKIVIPILNQKGYVVGDDFFQNLPDTENHFKSIRKIPNPHEPSQLLTLIDCPKWENVLRNRVIKLVKTREPNLDESTNNIHTSEKPKSTKNIDDSDPHDTI